MREDIVNSQIDSAKIPVGGDIAGALFAAGSTAILLAGIPALWYLFPAALVLGGAVALTLHFMRHQTPGESWILPGTKR